MKPSQLDNFEIDFYLTCFSELNAFRCYKCSESRDCENVTITTNTTSCAEPSKCVVIRKFGEIAYFWFLFVFGVLFVLGVLR